VHTPTAAPNHGSEGGTCTSLKTADDQLRWCLLPTQEGTPTWEPHHLLAPHPLQLHGARPAISCCCQLRPTCCGVAAAAAQAGRTTQGSSCRHMCCYNSPPSVAQWQGAGSLPHREQRVALPHPALQSHTYTHTRNIRSNEWASPRRTGLRCRCVAAAGGSSHLLLLLLPRALGVPQHTHGCSLPQVQQNSGSLLAAGACTCTQQLAGAHRWPAAPAAATSSGAAAPFARRVAAQCCCALCVFTSGWS
jgi:hypothetical protein